MPVSALTPEAIRAAVERLPRVQLAHLPTPLEELPRFASRLGGEVRVFVKDPDNGLRLGMPATVHLPLGQEVTKTPETQP